MGTMHLQAGRRHRPVERPTGSGVSRRGRPASGDTARAVGADFRNLSVFPSPSGHCSSKVDGGTPGAGATPGPAAGPPPVRRTVDLYAVSVGGSSRSVDPDIARADAVWRQCGVAVNLLGGESWSSDVLDREVPLGVLNEYSDPTKPTSEETEMLGHQPGGPGTMHLYYVPALSAGSLGEAFLPSLTPALPAAVVVADNAVPIVMAHELGHVLLDDASHHADPDNLMASGGVNTGVGRLEATQCSKV